jgi:hypothetical protein
MAQWRWITQFLMAAPCQRVGRRYADHAGACYAYFHFEFLDFLQA